MKMQWFSRVAVLLLALVSTACGTVYAQGRSYPYPQGPGPRGGVYRGGGYADEAYRRGYDDGYQRGLDAARDGDRYDPRRERWYRDADRGYDRRWGPRADYRQFYRDAFTRGYDAGFRDGRYRRNDPYRRRW